MPLDQSLLDPYAAQLQALQNRQRLAEMMVQDGTNGPPVYSPAAGIAKALTIAFGQMDAGRAEKGMLDLANKRQSDKQAELAKIIALASGQGEPSAFPQKDDQGNPMPAVSGGLAANNPRFALAKALALSSDPSISQAGLGMVLKGPDAPIVKEAGGQVVVLSPDGRQVINTVGNKAIAPPSIADATPESIALYQKTGDAAVLKPRIKQTPVDTGNGITFVNPEAPPGTMPKSMSPGEAATDARERATLADKGVRLPGTAGGGPGGPGMTVPPEVQQQRDAQRMQILQQERQQQIAQTGKSDPALEIEIADMQRRGFGSAPAAPSGMSPADQRAVAAQTAQGLAKGGVDYKTALDSRVQSGSDLMLRINEAQQALTQFQPGMGAETRLNVARAAQSLGMPDSIVQKINAGDVAAKQEFQKLAAQQAMESLKQAMGGTGRITQAEFKVFQQNNPNIELDPRAIGKIFDFSRRVFIRDQAEQSGMNDFVKGGGNIAEWPAVWTQTQLKAGLMGAPQGQQQQAKTVTRTGTLNGRRVVQYSDGSTDYAN